MDSLPRHVQSLCAAAVGMAILRWPQAWEHAQACAALAIAMAIACTAWAELDRRYAGAWLTRDHLAVRVAWLDKPRLIPLELLRSCDSSPCFGQPWLDVGRLRLGKEKGSGWAVFSIGRPRAFCEVVNRARDAKAHRQLTLARL